MRLVDADRFKEELFGLWRWFIDREEAGYGTTHREFLSKVEDILDNLSTDYDYDELVDKLNR